MEVPARLPELGKYKSPQTVDQRWQPRITDAPPRKPSSQATHHESAAITHIISFIMTRRYKKMFLSVKICSIQWGSVREEGVVAGAGGVLGAPAETGTHSRVTSRNSNDHYLQPLPHFTDIVDFRMLFIYIISLIHLPTLNIIFLSPWPGHAT